VRSGPRIQRRMLIRRRSTCRTTRSDPFGYYVSLPGRRHETRYELAPGGWAESVYYCGHVRGYERVSVRVAARGNDRVAVRPCVAEYDRNRDRPCALSDLPRHARVGGRDPDRHHGRGCGGDTGRVGERDPDRHQGRSCGSDTGRGCKRGRERCSGWGHERITGPAAGRVAPPIRKWQELTSGP
jgi:hypothetical protein